MSRHKKTDSSAAPSGIGSPALSDPHKDAAVKVWVPKVRQVLEEEFAAQLDRLGLRADGRHKPLDRIQLPAEALAVRGRLEALIARDTVAEDEINGYSVPADSTIFLAPYATHRHPSVWEDPETFDPERFAPGRLKP